MEASNALTSVAKIVQSHFDGMHYGEANLLRNVFHPDACLFGYYHGVFSCMASLTSIDQALEDTNFAARIRST